MCWIGAREVLEALVKKVEDLKLTPRAGWCILIVAHHSLNAAAKACRPVKRINYRECMCKGH